MDTSRATVGKIQVWGFTLRLMKPSPARPSPKRAKVVDSGTVLITGTSGTVSLTKYDPTYSRASPRGYPSCCGLFVELLKLTT